jgi:hypothetical protein
LNQLYQEFPGAQRGIKRCGLHGVDWLCFSMTRMRLITAHRILIGSAAVFFVFFAFWEWQNYSQSGEAWAAARSGLYFLVALGFGTYFKNIKRLYKLK